MRRAMPIGFVALVLSQVLRSFLATHPTTATFTPLVHHSRPQETPTPGPATAVPSSYAAPAAPQNDRAVQSPWPNYFLTMANRAAERARQEREEEARRREDDKRWADKRYNQKRDEQRHRDRAYEIKRAEQKTVEQQYERARSDASAAARRLQAAQDDARAAARRASQQADARAAQNAAWSQRRRY